MKFNVWICSFDGYAFRFSTETLAKKFAELYDLEDGEYAIYKCPKLDVDRLDDSDLLARL